MEECVIVTGAAGFSGAVLVEQLRSVGTAVYAVVRPGSAHNRRLQTRDEGIHVIECDMDDVEGLTERVSEKCDVFYHLAVCGGKTCEEQYVNVKHMLDALGVAAKLGCRRFVGVSSQAEYGVVPPSEVIFEERCPKPITAYGAAKAAACILTRQKAFELGIEWVWGRIFSVIGKYEPRGRMFPELYYSLKEGRSIALSSCRQNWDYLDVYDIADALIAIGERGVPGEIYNLASGEYRPLREYTEELRMLVSPDANITYGDDPNPFISLQPSVEKLKRHTSWSPQRTLVDSIRGYEQSGKPILCNMYT